MTIKNKILEDVLYDINARKHGSTEEVVRKHVEVHATQNRLRGDTWWEWVDDTTQEIMSMIKAADGEGIKEN